MDDVELILADLKMYYEYLRTKQEDYLDLGDETLQCIRIVEEYL